MSNEYEILLIDRIGNTLMEILNNNNGKCENLRMEIQFAVYSKTKNILMYFSEVDKSIINKVIVSGFELCCLSVESR